MVKTVEEKFVKLSGGKRAKVRIRPSRLNSIDLRLEAHVKLQQPLWIIQFYDDPAQARKDFEKVGRPMAKRLVKSSLKRGVYSRMMRTKEGIRMVIPLN